MDGGAQPVGPFHVAGTGQRAGTGLNGGQQVTDVVLAVQSEGRVGRWSDAVSVHPYIRTANPLANIALTRLGL